jgi:hypothetical protein
MTIILPAIIEEYRGKVLIFIDDIDYISEIDGRTTVVMKSNIEFEVQMEMEEIKRKIESATFKMFKLN